MIIGAAAEGFVTRHTEAMQRRERPDGSEARSRAGRSRRRGRALRFDQRLLRRGLELAATDRVLELGYDDLETPLLLVSGTVADGLPAPRQVVSLRPTVDLVEELQRHKPTHRGAPAAFEVRLADTIPAADNGSYDVALLLAPHYLGNERVRADIAAAHRALRPDGALFFQAHRRQGGETFARYAAERFGSVELLAIGGGHRLYRAVRGPGPPASASDEGEPETVVLQETVRGLTISLETQAGVFSRRRFDAASRLLAETMEIGPADEVADLGCGAGLLGIVAARLAPQGAVVLLDNRVQTVALAKRNLHRNGVANATVQLSDGLRAVGRRTFDVIVSNPPLHEGGVYRTTPAGRFVAAAAAQLRPRGQLFLVGPRTLPLPRLAAPHFEECEVVTADRVNVVWCCRRPRPPSTRTREPAPAPE